MSVCVCVCEREREREREKVYEVSDVAVLLHHGGYRYGSLCSQSIITEIKVCNTSISLQ